MKALILSLFSLVIASTAMAQTAKGSTSNIYRPIPKGGAGNANNSKFRTTVYKPTMHFYTRDNVISYRYAAVMSYSGDTYGGDYLGPQGAVFVPEEGTIPPGASIRNYASVNRRAQPGVGMASQTTTTKTTRRSTTSTKSGASAANLAQR